MMATKSDNAFLVYYLAKEFVNTYTNEVEFTFDIPVEKRLYVVEVKKDEEVHNQLTQKILKAEELKQEYIKTIL